MSSSISTQHGGVSSFACDGDGDGGSDGNGSPPSPNRSLAVHPCTLPGHDPLYRDSQALVPTTHKLSRQHLEKGCNPTAGGQRLLTDSASEWRADDTAGGHPPSPTPRQGGGRSVGFDHDNFVPDHVRVSTTSDLVPAAVLADPFDYGDVATALVVRGSQNGLSWELLRRSAYNANVSKGSSIECHHDVRGRITRGSSTFADRGSIVPDPDQVGTNPAPPNSYSWNGDESLTERGEVDSSAVYVIERYLGDHRQDPSFLGVIHDHIEVVARVVARVESEGLDDGQGAAVDIYPQDIDLEADAGDAGM